MKLFFSKYKLEIIIFSLALCVRLILFFINLDASNGNFIGAIHGDDGYYELSQGLLNGHGFSWSQEEPFLPNTLRTPLYIYFIAGLVFVFGSYLAPLIAQIILGSFIPILGFYIVLEIFSRRKIAFVTALLLAFEPYLTLFSSIFYTETLFIFLFLIFLILFIKYIKKGSLRTLIWSSFILGLATLTKTTVQYLPVIIFFLILWNFRKAFFVKKLIFHSILFPLVFIATISPWLLRNYLEFGVVGMTAQPAYNLHVYFIPSILSLENGTSFNSELNKYVKVEESSGEKITLANSKEYTKKDLAFVKDHPVGFLKSIGITIITFFTHDGMLTVLEHTGYIPDQYIGRPAISLLLSSPISFFKKIYEYSMSPLFVVLLMRIVWIIATIFFIIGLFIFMKNRKCDTVSIFLFLLIFYFVATSAIGGLGVNARYRMPVNPVILSFALTGFIYIRNAIMAKHEKRQLS